MWPDDKRFVSAQLTPTAPSLEINVCIPPTPTPNSPVTFEHTFDNELLQTHGWGICAICDHEYLSLTTGLFCYDFSETNNDTGQLWLKLQVFFSEKFS